MSDMPEDKKHESDDSHNHSDLNIIQKMVIHIFVIAVFIAICVAAYKTGAFIVSGVCSATLKPVLTEMKEKREKIEAEEKAKELARKREEAEWKKKREEQKRIEEEKRKREEERRKQEEEFKSYFKLGKSTLAIAALPSAEGLTFKNISQTNWDEMRVYLNPPSFVKKVMSGKDDTISDLIAAFSFFTHGAFAAPHNLDKPFRDIRQGHKVQIHWQDFVHMNTMEKFDPDRYRPSSAYVCVNINYKGKLREACNWFEL